MDHVSEVCGLARTLRREDGGWFSRAWTMPSAPPDGELCPEASFGWHPEWGARTS